MQRVPLSSHPVGLGTLWGLHLWVGVVRLVLESLSGVFPPSASPPPHVDRVRRPLNVPCMLICLGALSMPCGPPGRFVPISPTRGQKVKESGRWRTMYKVCACAGLGKSQLRKGGSEEALWPLPFQPWSPILCVAVSKALPPHPHCPGPRTGPPLPSPLRPCGLSSGSCLR